MTAPKFAPFVIIALACATLCAAQAPLAATPNDLNLLLAQLEQTAETTNLDLAKLRIEKWKGDGDAKQTWQANADSIARNLSEALPTLIAAARTSPQSLSANFKLYRNLDALYDVLSGLTEVGARYAPKSDYQTLLADVANLEALRRALADRVEALTGAQEAELARLRSGGTPGKSASGAKKIIVDDNAPARSTRKKKQTAGSPQ